MTAVSTISFPSSFQLRAGGALTDRRRTTTTAVRFLRGRGGIRKVDWLLRLTPVAQVNRVIKVRRSPGDSWVVNSNSNSKSWLDGFASWNWNGNAPDSQLLKEIFVAGLFFAAALSIGRRSRPRLDVLMQPLISQAEMSEASTDQENVMEVGNNKRKISTEHSTIDPERDASSSIESNEASESNYRGNNTDYKPPNVEASDLASSEKFLNDVTSNDLSFASEHFSERRNFQDGNSLVGSSSEEKDAHFPSERLSETEADEESFSVDAGVENSSSEEKYDLGNAQEISAEALESFFGSLNTTKPESSAAGTSVSDVAYTFSEENIGSFYSNNIETNSLFDPSNPGNIFTCAGIPAPTIVSAALPSVPEKVFVPAGVDEVQALPLAEFPADVQMQPLISLPEMSEASTGQENVMEVSNDERKISTEHSTTDHERDASSSIESNEASESNYRGNNTDYKPPNVEAPDFASSEKFPNDVTGNDLSFASEDFSERRNFQDGNSLAGSSSKEKDANFPSEKPERWSETEADQESFSVDAGVENSSSEEKFDLGNKQEISAEALESSFGSLNSAKPESSAGTSVSDVTEADQESISVDAGVENPSSKEKFDLGNAQEISAEALESFFGSLNTTKPESSAVGTSVSDVAYTFSEENIGSFYSSNIETNSLLDPNNPGNVFTSAGIPAPTFVSAALPSVPEEVFVPAGVDEVQALPLAELNVIEAAQAGDTLREYTHWLHSGSSALTRSSVSVYPTTYTKNGTELAFDNITAQVPNFSSIQGVSIERKEASESNYSGNETDYKRTGVEAPDLSSNDMSFASEDFLETTSSFGPSNEASAGVPAAPTVVSGTLLAFPGKVAPAAFQSFKEFRVHVLAKIRLKLTRLGDLIVARAFECTRLFQPTEAQAATGEASDFVGKDPAPIEPESMAESVVAAQNDLVAQVKEGVHATYGKELELEREKVGTIEKFVEAARHELVMLRIQREEENRAFMKEQAAIGSEILTKLTRDLKEELHTFFNQVEKRRKDEDERKAMSMTSSSAEEETKRARNKAKGLDLGVARESCCRQCIKVMSQMKNLNIHPHININLGTNGT